ncbi:hypothetical protein VIBNISFn118_1320048 [Vibrio nigripulchritudo SFn118]|nr:hypothetical protein VIBNISFn118_1320048 [Vibrio nigripulchritudo SFn118]
MNSIKNRKNAGMTYGELFSTLNCKLGCSKPPMALTLRTTSGFLKDVLGFDTMNTITLILSSRAKSNVLFQLLNKSFSPRSHKYNFLIFVSYSSELVVIASSVQFYR